MNTVKNKRVRRQKRSKFLTDLYAALIYAMFYIPVVVMIAFSFNDSKRNYAWTGFTTQWYGKLFSFGNHDLWESLVYSLVIAVLATIISVIIGVLGGIGLKKFEFRGKKFIGLMLYVPIVVPEIVLAVAMLIIFITVGVSLGMGTIIIGHCTFCIPYAVITIKGRISGDNETLQEASMDLGANQSTLPVLILSVNRTGITPDINALTTVMVLVMVVGMFIINGIQRFLKKREDRAVAAAENARLMQAKN